MKLAACRKAFETVHPYLYSASECREVFRRILEFLTGMRYEDLLRMEDIDLDELRLQHLLDEIKSGKPIQYITGYEWFGSLKLLVNPHVLIPRPETEELVHWIRDDIRLSGQASLRCLDIGTGSGCIAIALKVLFPSLQMQAMDISREALQLAARNAAQHHVGITFMEADILKTGFWLDESPDILISNPPYILPDEKTGMDKRVLAFEPHEALFVTNQDALQFYKAICLLAQQQLREGGMVYLELHQDHATDCVLLFREAGFEVTLKKDFLQNDRFLKAIKKPLR